MRNCGSKDLKKNLRRRNSIEFLIHGTNLVFIHKSKYINSVWLNSILNLILKLNLGTLFGKNPSCY